MMNNVLTLENDNSVMLRTRRLNCLNNLSVMMERTLFSAHTLTYSLFKMSSVLCPKNKTI